MPVAICNRHKIMFQKFQKGFTLIEMLVVLTIISILAGLVLTGMEAARKTGRDGKRRTDLEQIRSALEMCRADTGSYPNSIPVPTAVPCGPYLSAIPNDPLSPTYFYYYERLTDTTYNLCARIEVGGGAICGLSVACSTLLELCNYKVTNP